MARHLLSVRPAHARRGSVPSVATEDEDSPESTEEEAREPARRRESRTRWRKLRWPLVLVVAVALVAAAAGVQVTRRLPPPVTHPVFTGSVTVAGSPLIAWPAKGEAAVAVPALGVVVPSGPEFPVPIASLTKMMTAYVVLRDHPIAPNAQGPGVVVSAHDQAEAEAEADADDSSIPVKAGEVLTERQLLDGLLVHSADNFADILAEWDSGNVIFFVAKMNEVAASLKLSETHYADASGLAKATVSTAGDQLRLAEVVMRIPTFAAAVDQPTVTLPLAGTLSNFVHQIGTDGIVGVKSGFTDAAMGCLVLAANRTVDGVPVMIFAAVIGEPGLNPLEAAAKATVPLLDAAAANLKVLNLLRAGETVAEVTTVWSPHKVRGVSSRSVQLMVWPGERVTAGNHFASVKVGAPAGSLLGTMTISLGDEHERVEVLGTKRVTGPALTWRLGHF